MAVVPYYNKPPQEGLYRHFRAIAEAVDVPVILYNIPGRCVVNMDAETTLRLARDVENIVAVKEASGDLAQIAAIIDGAPGRLRGPVRRRRDDAADHGSRRDGRDLRREPRGGPADLGDGRRAGRGRAHSRAQTPSRADAAVQGAVHHVQPDHGEGGARHSPASPWETCGSRSSPTRPPEADRAELADVLRRLDGASIRHDAAARDRRAKETEPHDRTRPPARHPARRARRDRQEHDRLRVRRRHGRRSTRASCSPTTTSPGVDLVLPDYCYIVEAQPTSCAASSSRTVTRTTPARCRTCCATSPAGARPRLRGSRSASSAASSRSTASRKPKLREVKAGSHVSLGGFGFDFIQVNHSIPDGVGACSSARPSATSCTPATSSSTRRRSTAAPTDFAALAKAGRDGVLLLMSDSTGAERPATRGRRPTSAQRCAGSRARPTSASSSPPSRRTSTASSRSATRPSRRPQGRRHRPLDDQQHAHRPRARLPAHRRRRTSSTPTTWARSPRDRSSSSPPAARASRSRRLPRMANADHKTVTVEAGDTVVISASPVPGNEKAVSRVINRLFQGRRDRLPQGYGATSTSRATPRLRNSSSCSTWCKPTLLRAGPRRDPAPRAHTPRIAVACGHVRPRTSSCSRTATASSSTQHGRQGRRARRAGVVYVDGLSVGDVGTGRPPRPPAARQRRHRDDRRRHRRADRQGRGRVRSSSTRGVVFGPKTTTLVDEARARIAKALAKTAKEGVTDHGVIKRARARVALAVHVGAPAGAGR